jgi:hypothetical protein
VPVGSCFQTGQQVREDEDYTIIIPNFGDGYKSDNKIVGDEVFRLAKFGELTNQGSKGEGVFPNSGGNLNTESLIHQNR